MSFVVQRAIHIRRPLRLTLMGPSGGGKTWTALAVATELARQEGGEVVLVDTERRSGALYANDFPAYSVIPFDPPYHPSRYLEACQAGVEAGAKVIIIDSLSHAWSGQGGLLDEVDKAAARNRGGNSFNAWKSLTPIQNALVDGILALPCHVIVTVRVKTKYLVEERNGKSVPRKVGTVPIQREGLEYEFDIVGYMDPERNQLTVEKTRCSALNGAVIAKPGADVARTLLHWLDAGAPGAESQSTAAPATPPTRDPRPAPVQKAPTPVQTQPTQPTAQAPAKPAEAPKDVRALVGRLVERAATQFARADGGYLGDETVLMFLANRDLVERDERITSLADLAVLGAQQVIACGKAIATATTEDIAAAWEDVAAEAVEL